MIYFNDLYENFLFFFLSFAVASKTAATLQRRYTMSRNVICHLFIFEKMNA